MCNDLITCRMMKKDFAAPHDIIRHMRMEEVLEYCVSNIPGLRLTGLAEERRVSSAVLLVSSDNFFILLKSVVLLCFI